jgi:hypothetical protein
VSWSRNRPAPAKIPAAVRMPHEAAPLLLSAAEELKARAPREDFELEGYVVALDSENVRERGGTITVAAKVDGDTRRVRLSLGAEDYQVAIAAHGAMARVGCAGRLAKSGRQYELRSARGFALLGDE